MLLQIDRDGKALKSTISVRAMRYYVLCKLASNFDPRMFTPKTLI